MLVRLTRLATRSKGQPIASIKPGPLATNEDAMSEDNSQWEYQKGVIDAALDTQWIERRQALHESICKEPQLTWTKEKPTKEGFYWYREDGEKPEIVRCYSIDPIEGPLFWEMGCEQDFHGNSMEGEWYGPLEVPE
jgi:hypothetical protein